MSLILRHEPEKIGITLDTQGWANVDELLAGLSKKGYELSFADLEILVLNNDKQRYRFNEDKTRIRANQGHSLTLDLGLNPMMPPVVLYHGTAQRFMVSIRERGLQKRSRHHVHLSADRETALNVGRRHGKPVILTVQAALMHEAGFVFYQADNGVWLTDEVPGNYLV